MTARNQTAVVYVIMEINKSQRRQAIKVKMYQNVQAFYEKKQNTEMK